MDPVGVIFAVGMLGWMAYELFRRGPKNRTLLDQVAKQRGGKIVDGNLLLGVDGCEVEVRARLPVKSGEMRKDGEITWRVKVPPPGTSSMLIYPEGYKSFFLGGDDIDLGLHPRFDQVFRVKTGHAETLRRMWTAQLCATLVDWYPTGTLRSEHDVIELKWPGEVTTTEEVMRGVELVVALARADIYGIAALRTLPDAIVAPTGDVVIAGPGEIRLGVHFDQGLPRTRVTARVALDPKLELPKTVGPATLASTSEETTLTFFTIVEDSARLIAAIEFLRGFVVAPSQGVFR